MASSRAPIEIWAQILEFTFTFPLVVNEPPFTPALWLSATEYWSTERQRCILRLVCSSWRNCVDRRAHRLLHMWDFLRHQLPDECLLKAERINFDLPRSCGSWASQCDCTTSIVWLTDVGADNRHSLSKWRSVHSQLLLTSFIELKAKNPEFPIGQALDMSEISFEKEDAGLIAEFGRNLDLSSLSVHSLADSHIFQSLFTVFHRLTHLAIFNEPADHMQPQLQGITLPFLRSFTSGASYEYLHTLGFPSWNLPKLEVLCLGTKFKKQEDIISMAKSVGKSLKSFHCDRLGSKVVINEAIWQHFPSLESSTWVPCVPNPHVFPPKGHPLSTVLIYPHSFDEYYHNGETKNSVTRISRWLAEAPYIDTIKFSVPWSAFHDGKTLFLSDETTWVNEMEAWIRDGTLVVDAGDVIWGLDTSDVKVPESRNPLRHR